MRNRALTATIFGILVCVGIAASAGAGSHDSLAGKVFAVRAEVTFSLDPSFPAGTTFNNCYTFNEDGSWDDPLFPDFSAPIPGVWVQYTERPKIRYTATVSALAPGLLLIQNGTVKPGRDNDDDSDSDSDSDGKRASKLTAYTTVFVNDLRVVDVLSKGKAVDTCPYF